MFFFSSRRRHTRCALVTGVQTCALPISSLPTYTPNKLTGSNPTTRRNAVTYNLYELGSTFKPLSIGAAIDAGTVTSMARRYDATAPLPIAGFRIRDSHPGRWYNVPETLIESSNIATARIADELDRKSTRLNS